MHLLVNVGIGLGRARCSDICCRISVQSRSC